MLATTSICQQELASTIADQQRQIQELQGLAASTQMSAPGIQISSLCAELMTYGAPIVGLRVHFGVHVI